jgi:hypothetical protein
MSAYAKSIVGALLAFLTGIAASLDDNNVSAQEWVTAVVAALVTLAGVFAVPNTRAPGAHTGT